MDLSSPAAVQRKTEEVKDNAKSPVRNPLSEPQPNNTASLKSLELQLMAGALAQKAKPSCRVSPACLT